MMYSSAVFATIAIVLSSTYTCDSFKLNFPRRHSIIHVRASSEAPDGTISATAANEDDFNGSDFNKVLNKAGPIWNMDKDNEVISKLREEQIAREENIFREYPFQEIKLPVLPDCNNYFSGKFGDYFWHQNADQVYVYIPIDESITKSDIEAEFNALSVSIKIKGENAINFKCIERIIPDGSFWTFEKDNSQGKRYLQLDLEKRYRMINWKSLFGEPKVNPVIDDQNRADMLEKLLAANKGMSRLTGKPAQTMPEMLETEEVVRMMGQKYFPDKEVLGAEDGEEITPEEMVELETVEAELDEEAFSENIIDAEVVRDIKFE